jgi:hypothetical protein
MGNARNLGSLLNTSSTIQADDLNIGQLGNRNLIINGAMQVAQRGTSFTSGAYTLDRWRLTSNDASFNQTVEQSTDAPPGFKYSWKTTITSPDTSITNVERASISTILEGQDIVKLGFGTNAATSISLSFWVKSSISGIYSVNLWTGNLSRNYSVGYNINSVNTWEYKTITIGGDTGGTWPSGNERGLWVVWSYTAGPNSYGTPNWQSGDIKNGVTGQVNLISTNGATFQITGVQLEAGANATPFEHRSYGQELALCQRYYQTTFTTKAPENGASISTLDNYYAPAWMHSSGSATVGSRVEFAVPMRADPTITYYNSISVSSNSGIWGRYDGSLWQDGFSAMSAHGLSSRGFCPAPYGLSGNNTTNYLILGGYAAEAEL